jgi:hypothetical protein
MLRKLAPPKSKQSAEIAQSDAAKQVENETSKRYDWYYNYSSI